MKKKKHSAKKATVAKLVIIFALSLLAVFLLVGKTPNNSHVVSIPIDPGLIDTRITEAQPPGNPDGIHVAAWCDHMPIWKESGLRRHVAVTGHPNTEINSFEVRLNDASRRVLLGACVRLGEQLKEVDLSHMETSGMFNEHMHGVELEVTVQYTLKVDGKRVKKSFITRCVINEVK